LDVTLHVVFGGHVNQFKDYYLKSSQIGYLGTGIKLFGPILHKKMMLLLTCQDYFKLLKAAKEGLQLKWKERGTSAWRRWHNEWC